MFLVNLVRNVLLVEKINQPPTYTNTLLLTTSLLSTLCLMLAESLSCLDMHASRAAGE